MMNRRHRVPAVAMVAALLVAACSGESSSDVGGSGASNTEAPDPSTATDMEVPTPLTLGEAGFSASPGTYQVTVTGANEGDELVLLDSDDAEVAFGTADANGALLFRRIVAGDYRVADAARTVGTDMVTVYDEEFVPEQSFYADQVLPAGGFGYLTTRDGTTLSINVSLPGPADAGPYPTVVEYSGYAPSNPADTTFGQLFNTLGYAYVGVNMRGTGCSGGSFRFFEKAQWLDGYDAVETIAAQPWVRENRVGMVGISYPGISQLFVASTRPPSLAAITPLSVIDDSYRATLYPGGILNTGFAVDWTRERIEQAAPFGQGWTKERADGGDQTCADNQLLRLQNPDLLAEIDANPFYTADVGDEINPSLLVGAIDVPVFIAGAWQDEQTGGRWPALIDDFVAAPHVYATLVNGLHTEALSPSIFPRYVEFLDLYVAERTPDLAAASVIAPVLTVGIYGVSTPIVAPNRFQGMTYEDALAQFEGEPKIRVLFEQGAADGQAPASPLARWTAEFDEWPLVGAEMTAFTLGSDGVLGGAPGGSTTYVADPDAVPTTFYNGSGSGIWRSDVRYEWVRNPSGTAAEFTSAPLTDDLVVIGAGTAALWISVADADDTDLEVTISELRPDGTEVYVQSGWLRASHTSSNDDEGLDRLPEHSHLAADASPLVLDEPRLVRVEMFPVAHPFRAESRIRITIDAPGGNRGVWAFRTISAGETVTILHDDEHPSTVWFPVVRGLDVPAGVAACGSLRGQPCRPMTDD